MHQVRAEHASTLRALKRLGDKVASRSSSSSGSGSGSAGLALASTALRDGGAGGHPGCCPRLWFWRRTRPGPATGARRRSAPPSKKLLKVLPLQEQHALLQLLLLLVVLLVL